jgi:23S rRNA (cytosine1962-C5)-methyltransferase
MKYLPQCECADWPEYQLIDSGNRLKLERFGSTWVIRSEPKAWWKPDHDESFWKQAHARFDDAGNWQLLKKNTARQWQMRLGSLTFQARLTDMSKHLGVFPEQEPHWRWINNQLSSSGTSGLRVLNLFGYTGAATLVAAAAGAQVTHVDASKPAIAWARENQALSGLEEAPVRWILEDALKYVRREIRRGVRYHGILMDPPSFGRGPNGEVWKVEEQIVTLLDECRQLLDLNSGFLVLTLYNLEASALMLHNLVGQVMSGNGTLSSGELALQHRDSEKQLPLSLYSRWSAK